MGIFLRHSHNVKPERWGSEADIQYAIRKNSEKIYGVDPDSNVLVMPLFFGFPCLDFSGKQNHGTPVGGVAYHSGSLDFNGTTGYVDGGSNPSLDNLVDSGDFSGAAQIYMTAHSAITGSPGWRQRIFAKRNAAPTDGWVVSIGDIKSIDFVSISAGSGDAIYKSSADDIPLNQWKFVAFAYTNSSQSAKLYIDGQEVSYTVQTAGVDATHIDSSASLRIGASYNLAAYQFFNGLIPEVRINNIALTAEQIALFYARPWDLYRRVGRTYYSIAAAPSIYIPRIMIF